MSIGPLPTTLDVRKAAARGVTVSGTVELNRLTRLREMLASDGGCIEARCEFHRDEENRSVVEVTVDAHVTVTCQRCLEPMPLAIASRTRLAIVGDDSGARQLPSSLEPWIVEGETGDLWALIEDDLILEIPAVAYHETDDCNKLMDAYRRAPAADDVQRRGDNPFKVLEQLKSGATQQEK